MQLSNRPRSKTQTAVTVSDIKIDSQQSLKQFYASQKGLHTRRPIILGNLQIQKYAYRQQRCASSHKKCLNVTSPKPGKNRQIISLGSKNNNHSKYKNQLCPSSNNLEVIMNSDKKILMMNTLRQYLENYSNMSGNTPINNNMEMRDKVDGIETPIQKLAIFEQLNLGELRRYREFEVGKQGGNIGVQHQLVVHCKGRSEIKRNKLKMVHKRKD